MSKITKIKDPDVAEVFESYPAPMRKKLLFLRRLVLETGSDLPEVEDLKETLKWGEPSYVSKTGSTIRMDWKKASPQQYAMFFNCNTTLVETFKELYGDTFTFDGKRAIVFTEWDEIPVPELKHCISLSLTYHRVKHLPMLGV